LFFIPFLHWIFSSRWRAYYYFFAAMFCDWIISLGKMGYHDPRPFMVAANITPFGCSGEFGNPSGHAQLTSAMLIMQALDYMNSNVRASSASKALAIIGAVFGTLLVGFTRLYNGVHSMDQLVFGWCLGTWQAVFFEYEIRVRLMHHV